METGLYTLGFIGIAMRGPRESELGLATYG